MLLNQSSLPFGAEEGHEDKGRGGRGGGKGRGWGGGVGKGEGGGEGQPTCNACICGRVMASLSPPNLSKKSSSSAYFSLSSRFIRPKSSLMLFCTGVPADEYSIITLCYCGT